MENILIILACIASGMLFGFWRRRSLPLLRASNKACLGVVYGLLFILGAGLGSNKDLLARLPSLGLNALIIAVCCTMASALSMTLLSRFFAFCGERSTNPKPGGPSPLTGSLYILCAFVLGVFMAAAGLVPAFIADSALAVYAIYLLITLVGIGIGADSHSFRIIRDLHVNVLAVPLCIVLASFMGALAAAAILPGLSARDALCAGAGLGYSSLASVLIENAGEPDLASVALLANILREIMTILAAPVLARRLGRLSTVGAAGVTAMDTALPAIARFSGERVAIIAVFSGTCLTLLVPFIIAVLLKIT